jgi:hypothetical protein
MELVLKLMFWSKQVRQFHSSLQRTDKSQIEAPASRMNMIPKLHFRIFLITLFTFIDNVQRRGSRAAFWRVAVDPQVRFMNDQGDAR